jgi:hypothetical protein
VCEQFLVVNGLTADYQWMVDNARMHAFTELNTDTYKELTWEFLSSFEEMLDTMGADPVCSFTI